MSYTAGARLIPTAAGGANLVAADGTLIMAFGPTGTVTGNGGTTIPAFVVQSVTTTQRDAMTAVAGTLVYNTSTGKLNVKVAAAWEAITSA